jgi:uncharacterized membrane protein YdjX (TVP38/TMEM64 family)
VNAPASAPRRRVLASRAGAAIVVLGLASGAILARRGGIDAQTLQRALLDLGLLAAPVFVVAFAAGELLHLPGILFVVVARAVFGPLLGLVLGYAGAVVALSVAFLVARRLVSAARATSEPWRPRWPFLRRTFERLESRPVSSIALLRLVLWLAPPLTYALAATKVRARDHLLGCALGLVVPVVAANLVGGALL